MSKDEKPTGDIQVKALESFEIKNESTGEVEAIIATLDVVDKDSEVITKDAITSGCRVKVSSYGHDIVGSMFGGGSVLPAGKGAVYVEGDKAIFRGKLFLSTERGRDTLSVLKEMGKDQEWSFGFRVIGSEVPDDDWRKQGAERILTKLDVFEVSPVLIGAGVGTRTVAAKELMKEAVKEADEEAGRAKVEEEARQKVETEADAKRVGEEAAAEAARVQAEKEAAEEKAAREKAQEEARETKRLEDEAEEQRKKEASLRLAATLEYERFQRTMQRPFARG